MVVCIYRKERMRCMYKDVKGVGLGVELNNSVKIRM